MKRYWYPLIFAKQFRGFRLRISRHNVVPSYRNGVDIDRVDVGFGRSLGLMYYTSGNLGLNRIPANFDDVRSNGGVKVSETVGDLGDFRGRNRGEYVQNAEHFQQRSNPGSHNPVNGGTNTQDLGHGYVEKVVQQNPSFSGGEVAAPSQYIDGQWRTNPGQFHQYSNRLSSINAVSHHPDGYQQENTGFQPSWGGYNLKGGEPYGVNVNVNDEKIEGTVKELDALIKCWDLENAVRCMEDLSSSGVDIDLPRYLALIEACGKGRALIEAKAVHEHLLKHISPVSASVFNKILEMYGKCGSMTDAYDTFNKMPERNLTSWDNMIVWYAKNGMGEEAIDMFTKFKEAGLKPDGQMFLGLFDACGVVGDVVEGMLHFDSMSKIYGISPTMDHYASIVRMFGSACDLDGALEFIEKMPVEPTVDVWESLMNMSRIQGNIELGDRCVEIIDHLDPSRLTKESKSGLVGVKDSDVPDRKVKKTSLSTHTQHEYRAGDRSHPDTEKLYALLRGFKESMKEAGYVPETRFVLHDITQEEKEEAIMAHSERLASAQSLLTTSPRAEMRIIKNLRVCGDCHVVFKILSKLVGRRIVMRDQKRFHHFEDGKCSCNDYW